MSLTLSQNYTAVVPGSNFVQFLASGGTSPYIYSVLPGGAGGTINSSSGQYLAPSQMTAYPATSLYDTISVIDAALFTTTSKILIGSPLFMFCDVLQNQLNLDSNHVYLWDQKIFQPTDSGLYVAVSVESCKPFANNNYFDVNGNPIQTVNMYAQLGLDLISRGPAARDMKELVILALNSTYAQQQQEANQFYIGKLSTGFTNLSHIDGAAIPYRFHISVALQYITILTPTVPYYDTFEPAEFYTNP